MGQLSVLYLNDNQMSGNIPDFAALRIFYALSISYNCFDVSPGSQVGAILPAEKLESQWIPTTKPWLRTDRGTAGS